MSAGSCRVLNWKEPVWEAYLQQGRGNLERVAMLQRRGEQRLFPLDKRNKTFPRSVAPPSSSLAGAVQAVGLFRTMLAVSCRRDRLSLAAFGHDRRNRGAIVAGRGFFP